MLAAKAALHGGATPLSVLAVSLCCVLWLAFLLIAHGRIRTLASANRPRPPRRTPPRRLCTLALAVCGALLVL